MEVNMIENLKKTIKNFDVKIKKTLVSGLYFSLIVSIIGTIFLIYYISFKSSNYIYYIGLKTVSLSISLCVSFFLIATHFLVFMLRMILPKFIQLLLFHVPLLYLLPLSLLLLLNLKLKPHKLFFLL